MSEEPKKRIVTQELPLYPRNEWEVIFGSPLETIKKALEIPLESMNWYTTEATETAEKASYTMIDLLKQPLLQIDISQLKEGTHLKVYQLGRDSTYNIVIHNIFMLMSAALMSDKTTLISDAPKPLIDLFPKPDPTMKHVHSDPEIATLLAELTRQIEENPIAPLEREEESPKPTTAEILAIYKKRKRQEKLLTLKQVCEELGVNYGSVRVAKARIEKRKSTKKKR